MPDPATPEKIMEAVTAFREDVAGIRKHALTPDEKARILTVLDRQEDDNQKRLLAEKRADNLEASIAEQKAKIEELTTKAVTADALKAELNALEALIAQRPGHDASDPKAWKQADEYKALQSWAQKGRTEMDSELKALMRSDVDVAGGFLAPTEFDNALIKEIVELDPIRSLARVTVIGSKAIEMAVRTDIPRATYEGEAVAASEDGSTYRLVTATPYRQTLKIPITLDLLMNSAFDMESELMGDARVGFAEGEGQGFVAGTGHKVPEGVTQNATVIANLTVGTDLSAIDTTDATEFADAIIAITGELKVGYNATYLMHRRTMARIRQLRDAVGGQFLWQPGLNGPVSNTINGYPYVLTPSLSPWDSVGGDIMLFGDFSRGYRIIDRTGLAIVRDDVTRAGEAIVLFVMHRWNTGIVTVPEAFRMMRRA